MKHMKSCINCRSTRLYYAFSVNNYRLIECADCDYLGMYPQPSDAALADIYGESYALLSEDESGSEHAGKLKRATAEHYLGLVERYRGRHGGRLLEIGCGSGDFLVAAADRGYEVTGVEYSPYACERTRSLLGGRGTVIQGEIQEILHQGPSFDVCVLNDVLEHARDPRALLSGVHSLLKPGGTLFVATPSLDSWSAKLMKNRWMEFKPEHLHYFDQNTLHSLLFQTGYRQVLGLPGVKTLSLDYVFAHFQRFPAGTFSTLIRLAVALVPQKLRRKPFRTVASGMIALASSTPVQERGKLTIVVPAYNEAATLGTVMTRLLSKDFGEMELEIILVESNSSDGTREVAMQYRQDPRVRLILEARPQGKGHAVRAGLAHATGEFILIQDADLEYDLEDYEVLLKPLAEGSRAFVLGARHGGKIWKLRVFSGKRLLSGLLNFGHWFFKTLINVFFGLKLEDPFTMYKVFRRDCLTGLSFECNYFDFDFELLIKLVRNGYRPVEIPVNYRSRSFEEGKKVSLVRDPVTWLRAVLRLRLQRKDPLAVIEAVRRAGSDQLVRAVKTAAAHEP
jgi:glycosyltransferase involved in cell wall biosynthesis/SAM-dependent methyltransferase